MSDHRSLTEYLYSVEPASSVPRLVATYRGSTGNLGMALARAAESLSEPQSSIVEVKRPNVAARKTRKRHGR